VTKTIAIVEDDPRQRAHYADALRRQGYEVDEYGGREAAQRAFEQVLPDLAILDIMLEQDIGGGFEICRYLQRRDAQLPVIFSPAAVTRSTRSTVCSSAPGITRPSRSPLTT